MPHEGTTAVLKDVERAGQTFQQHYWMKLEDLAATAEKDGWQKAVMNAGGKPSELLKHLKSWTGSSTSPEGLALQGAAMKLMGGNIDDWPVGSTSTYAAGVKEGHADKSLQQTVLAAQATTRAVLEANNYKPRTMYRGMTGKVAAAILENAKKLADQGIPYHEAAMGLKLNPLNSFSEKVDVASGFGGSGSASGVILAVHEVPASAYVSHYKVQGGGTVGFGSEKEGIIITQGTTGFRMQDIRGGVGKEIVNYFKSKGLYDESKVENDDHPPGGWAHKHNPNQHVGKGGEAVEEDEPSAPAPKYEKTGTKWSQWMTKHMATLDPNLSVADADKLKTKIDASTLDYLNEHGFAKTGQKFSEDQIKQIIHGFTEHHVTGTPKPGPPKELFGTSLGKSALDDVLAKHEISPGSSSHAALQDWATGKYTKKDLVNDYGKILVDHLEDKGALADLGPGAPPKKMVKPSPVKKMNFGNLPAVDELPDIPEHLAKTPVQQKKGKGAVPEWGGAKTWRDLWVKWAKQHAKEQGHTESSAKAVAHNAVDKANVDLKKFIAHKNPAKAQFKAFFAKVIQEHIPKKK